MNQMLNAQTLAAMGARAAVLSAGRYALPVRFRVRAPAMGGSAPVVECRVPAWSGVGDLLDESAEVTLVAFAEEGSCLRWLFIRGIAAVVPDPDWEGLQLPAAGDRVGPDDLYHLVRIVPKRIEQVDEQRGWGVRHTADL